MNVRCTLTSSTSAGNKVSTVREDHDDRWEVGSEFHWDDDALVDAGAERPDWLPTPHTTFSSATGALSALISALTAATRLHVPSYFCMGVAEALTPRVKLAWYRELPDGQGPHLDTLDAAPGDAVLVVNLFGRGRREPWDAWSREHPLVTVIEDHTHDPLSAWARASAASYCVASLRKTLPVPDGAIVWSPRGENLPRPVLGASTGASLKLTAMILKTAWLRGRDVDKSEFRALQMAGEAALRGSATAPHALTHVVLPLLDVWRLRSIRADNARALAKSMQPRTSAWHPVSYGSPEAVPFNLQVLCTSEASRDSLLAHLARERIFAPVHWRQSATGFWSGDHQAVDYASRMLTIPVDHRYRAADVGRIVEALERFAP
jgi:hypothetical protein